MPPAGPVANGAGAGEGAFFEALSRYENTFGLGWEDGKSVFAPFMPPAGPVANGAGEGAKGVASFAAAFMASR